eukprot:TRINITY_DN825_c0_g1_i6.p1 TRINITY_DN825_c0_g1~~TRINITY_DN825_c0_g1_i6.p1  ORF type:complete len:109 (+),score=14.06 TRINITY_DN825_c0_g1_i6:1075-1401(+)
MSYERKETPRTYHRLIPQNKHRKVAEDDDHDVKQVGRALQKGLLQHNRAKNNLQSKHRIDKHFHEEHSGWGFSVMEMMNMSVGSSKVSLLSVCKVKFGLYSTLHKLSK